MQTAIFELLENTPRGGEILAMGVTTTKEERFNILWEKWHKERIKRKINQGTNIMFCWSSWSGKNFTWPVNSKIIGKKIHQDVYWRNKRRG